MAGAMTRIEATYQVPFLAHATMEPVNCTVHVRSDGCEAWVGSQALARAHAAAAKAAGLPLDRVVVHNHLIGGGFGPGLEADYVARAVEIATQGGRHEARGRGHSRRERRPLEALIQRSRLEAAEQAGKKLPS